MQIEKVASIGIIKVDGVPVTSVMKSATFDGKVPWLIYVRQFEGAATGNKWNSPVKVRALVLALRCEAMEVLRNTPEEKQNDYEFIVTFLGMRYEEAQLQALYNAQLQEKKKQKYNESLQEYKADIMKLINLIYPTYPEEIKQELAVNSCIEGLLGNKSNSENGPTEENFQGSCLCP